MAALVCAVAFFCSTVLPLQTKITALRAEVATASTAPAAHRIAPPREQVAAFIAGLPQRNNLPGVLAAIVQQAETCGLSLDRGNYQWSVGKSGAIAQYQLTLPVKGSYPEVRKFVDATLAAVPAAALAGITLERPNVGDAQVSADLRFVIFVRSLE
jgi:Tfp pilus assembly protein PilO